MFVLQRRFVTAMTMYDRLLQNSPDKARGVHPVHGERTLTGIGITNRIPSKTYQFPDQCSQNFTRYHNFC